MSALEVFLRRHDISCFALAIKLRLRLLLPLWRGQCTQIMDPVLDGLGFGVWGLGFGVWGLGFGVWGLGFGFRVWGLGFRV